MTAERKRQIQRHVINFGIPAGMVIPLLTWIWNIYQGSISDKITTGKIIATQEIRIKMLEKQDSIKTITINMLERKIERHLERRSSRY